MVIFWIIIIPLWVLPFITYYVIRLLRHNTALRSKIVCSAGILTFITLAAILACISTSWHTLNVLLTISIYFTVSLLIWLGYFYKNRWINITARIMMVLVFGLGYLVSTVGLPGLVMIAGDLEPEREIKLNNHLTYYQYSLGGGLEGLPETRICLFKNYSWLPFIHKMSFEKKYDRIYFRDTYKTNYPILYSDDFKVRYDAGKNTVLLLDSANTQVIHIPE